MKKKETFLIYNIKKLFKSFASAQSTTGQIARYVAVGGSAVLLDFIIYRSVIFTLGLITLAKVIGYISGTVYSFCVNRTFTFKCNNFYYRQIVAYVAVYIASMFINVAINSIGLFLLGDGEMGVNTSFTIAAVITSVFNFVCIKKFVFKL